MASGPAVPLSPDGDNSPGTAKHGSKARDAEDVCDVPRFDGDLSICHRFVLYGLCGLAVEIYFTAIWEVLENGNRKLQGITSIYAMIIYGLCSLVLEWLYLHLYHLRWYYRGLIYLAWTYSWEFSTGYFLRQFDACPWDYEPYLRGHVMGLITMEYAPLWYVGTMFQERYITRNALRLCWKPITDKKSE